MYKNLKIHRDLFELNKGDESRFKKARPGDHLMTTFRCDFCLFFMLKQRPPITMSSKDDLLLCALRPVNLDALWANETKTVYHNRLDMNKAIELSESIGIEPPFVPLGPFDLNGDSMDVGMAVLMVLKSLTPGRYGS